MHFKAKNLRIPKHPRLLFLAQNLGVLQPSKTRYHFLWDTLYKIWNISIIPKLISQPKCIAQSPEIKVSNIVYFQKTEADLDSVWTVGQIDSVVKGHDGNVGRVKVSYYNGNEQDCPPRFNDKAVRSNVEDNHFIDDMKEDELMIENLNKKGECCCEGHCHRQANMVTLSDSIKVSKADDKLIDPDDTITDQHDAYVCDSSPGLYDEFEKLLYPLETPFDPEAIEECDYLDPPPHCSHLHDNLP